MKQHQYVGKHVKVLKNDKYEVKEDTFTTRVENKNEGRLGVMIVGWGGSNGSTLTAGLLAKYNDLTWNNKNGEHKVEFLGSVSQFGSVHIGYDTNGEPHSKLFKELGDMYRPEDLVIGGWDVCSDNLYEAARKAAVLDYDLLKQLEGPLSKMKPYPSIYDQEFIANNQMNRADNIITNVDKKTQLDIICKDIFVFKESNCLDDVIILWSASTERFHNGTWKNHEELYQAIVNNDPEVSPSILFAFAAAHCGFTFLNGSPQNTICPAIIDKARHSGTFVGGEDFKTGQTKLKSVLADWLASSAIRPLSIVSYNHLGNNDGKNLDEAPQFRSKEITKKNVIDDIVEENPKLFPSGNPDHAVVIKYIPAVGDTKRAMDEYYSQLFLGGHHTLAIHNTCEDSLLAAPLMLDLILFAEFFSRVRISRDGESQTKLGTVLSLLSFFFKAPVVNDKEPLINAFFKQRYGLENFFRILNGFPPLDHINLNSRV
jgi:myo-inositol-1-phosphate synthase